MLLYYSRTCESALYIKIAGPEGELFQISQKRGSDPESCDYQKILHPYFGSI